MSQHPRGGPRPASRCHAHHSLPQRSRIAHIFAPRYIFPSVESTGTSAGGELALRFGGLGLGLSDASAGLRCGAAMTSFELDGVLAWLDARAQTAFFGNGPDALAAFQRTPRQARYLRTQLRLDYNVWARLRRSTRGLGLTDILAEESRSDLVRIYSDLLETNYRLRNLQLEKWVINDVVLLAVAAGLVMLYMTLHFHNALFALAAVMQLVISFPIVFVIVDVVLRQRPVSAFASTSLWVVMGVSADNIFVLHETWVSAKLLRVNGEQASRERRLRWTLSQSARPLVVADGTTAFALFLNCVSPITGVFQFGLCGGLLILTNFVLVLVHMPCLLILEERGALRAARCCRLARGVLASEQFGLRFLHSVHGRLFQWRRPLLLAFVAGLAEAAAPPPDGASSSAGRV